jgi:GT2 family glycosyltransferase
VPAVTAACLLIDAGLFKSIGGLSGAYLQGDYEDSDLCLRLLESGRNNWYFPGVSLYHLEAQSYPSSTRSINRQYNRWLFNEVWAGAIERALARPEMQIPRPEPGQIHRNGTREPLRSNGSESTKRNGLPAKAGIRRRAHPIQGGND